MKDETKLAIEKIVHYSQKYKFNGKRAHAKFKVFNEHCRTHGGVSETFLRRCEVSQETIKTLLRQKYICVSKDEKYKLVNGDRCVFPLPKILEIEDREDIKDIERRMIFDWAKKQKFGD